MKSSFWLISETCVVVNKTQLNTVQDSNKMKPVIDFVGGFLSYFTIWSLIVFSVYLYFPHPFLFHPMKTMLLQSSVGGFYITYVYPTELYVPYCKFFMKGWSMKLLDVLSHHLPFLYVCLYLDDTQNIPFVQKWLSVFPLLFYSQVFCLSEKYWLRANDIYLLRAFLLGIHFLS